jgi:cytoplasmic iron level regulating protein YaaA (DUF328/UPF0246 family)
MLTLLTPSKTMDFDSPLLIDVISTTPIFLTEATQLRETLKKLSARDIQALMKVSQPLALATHQKIAGADQRKVALWAYVGDVYKGFQAASLDAPSAEWAQSHLLIPSGLYGLLRPLDEIQAYRLEMKAALQTGDSMNLYDFWGDKLGAYIETHARGQLLILSSQEYARTIVPYLASTTRVVTPAFIDKKPNGNEEQVAIYNKMMRGVMARWIVDQRIDDLAEVTTFTAHDYRYSPERSAAARPVFYREIMKPLVFH